MPTRGAIISQNDFAGLAALANQVLKPLVDAAIWAGTWPISQSFDYFVDANQTTLVYPQPAYNFGNGTLSINLVPPGATYDGSGNYTLAVLAQRFYNWTAGANEAAAGSGITFPTSSGNSFYYNNADANPGGEFIQSYGCTSAILHGTPYLPVTASVQLNLKNWRQELNRIRGDYWTLLFGANAGVPINAGLYLTPAAVLSGPWCVGVNDPVTFPQTVQGQLLGDYGGMTVFKNVQFYYAAADAKPGFSVSAGRNASGQLLTGATAGVAQTATLNYVADTEGTWTVTVSWGFTGAALPAAAAFTPSAIGVAPVWTTQTVSPGNFLLVASFTTVIAPGSGTITLTANPAAGYTLNSNPYPLVGVYAAYTSSLSFGSTAAFKPVNVVHPGSNGYAITGPGVGAAFTLNGTAHGSFWQLSDATVKGVWVAMTLPTPGLNVFLDNDIPPYVSGYGSSGGGVAGSPGLFNLLPDYLDNPVPAFFPIQASSMRQMTLFDRGEYYLTIGGVAYDSGEHYFNIINQSCQTQAATWAVLRDTDFVPFNLGSNYQSRLNTSASQTLLAGASNNYSFSDFGFVAASTCVGIKLTLVQPGTPGLGWVNGQLSAGTALASNLKIFVSTKAGWPNPANPATYDFVIAAGNSVVIPNAGGANYLQNIINGLGDFRFTIQNTNGVAVSFAIVVEMDFSAAPARQYFPLANEPFSNCLTGNARVDIGYTALTGGQKPIPQNGYCIFNLCARRLPVANTDGIMVTPTSGAAIVVTVGQNRLAWDGSLVFEPFFKADGVSPFTITIPAAGRDTGNVSVFWPVLAGTEIVYQANTQIILEVLANWQPLFHAQQYGFGNGGYSPTAFEYCGAFVNFFSRHLANYPFNSLSYPGQMVVSKTQFPMSVEIFNDLENSLLLLGVPDGS